MAHINFMLGWFAFWLTMISTFVCLYQLAFIEGSRKRAKAISRKVKTSSGPAIGRSFDNISRFFAFIFGERILSFQSLYKSFLLSLLIFLISLEIAVLTTSDIRKSIAITINNWHNDLRSPETLHFSVLFSLCIAVIGILFEFLYVAKTRLSIRIVSRSSTNIMGLVVILGDIASTIAMFVLLNSTLILMSAFCLHWVVKDQLLDDTIEVHGVINNLEADYVLPIGPRQRDPTSGDGFKTVSPYPTEGIYKLLIADIYKQSVAHFEEGFSRYHTISIGFVSNKRQKDEHSVDLVQKVAKMNGESPEDMDKYGAVYPGYEIDFPLTTMLVSSFSLVIWVGLSSFIFLFSRSLFELNDFLRKSFVFIHGNPEFILKYGILSSVLVAVAGGILIPMIFDIK